METLVGREKLTSDVKTVLDDVESLLKQASATSGQQANELRERAAAALNDARARLREMQNVAVESAKAKAQAADRWVYEHSWKAVGISAGIAFLLGLLVARR